MIGLITRGLMSAILAGSLALTPQSPELPPIYRAISLINVANAPQTEDPFAGFPTLKKICACESGLKHFENDGVSVLQGKINANDIGICQINKYYHENRIEKLSIDIYLEEGNIEYAKDLYRRQGTKPWNASIGCWNV
jgi:hypothetical protein